MNSTSKSKNITNLHLVEVMYQQGKVIIRLGSDKNIYIHILTSLYSSIEIDYHNVHLEHLNPELYKLITPPCRVEVPLTEMALGSLTAVDISRKH